MSEFDLIYKLDLSNEENKKIVKDYGSVEEFCRRYILYIQGDKSVRIRIPKSVSDNLANFFDLSNMYVIGENSGYAELVADILKIRPGFVTYGPVDEIINSSMDEALSEQDKDIVRALYNLDGKKRTMEDLDNIYHIGQREILTRKQRAVKRLSAGRKNGQLQLLSKLVVDKAIVDDVMQNFLVEDDAVAESDYSKVSKRKFELVEAILFKEIEYLTFTGDFNYIFQSFDVKTKIRSSILSDEKKRALVDRAEEKVKEIACANKDKIIALFNDRISKLPNDDNAKKSYKLLEKEIRSSGLDQESIQILCNGFYNQQQVVDEKDSKALVNYVITRIRFPQKELSIDSMPISEKAKEVFRNSNLTKVGDIIQYSRRQLTKFGGLRWQQINEMLIELEKIGYDIPTNDSVSIESYNHDKIYEDTFSKITDEISTLNVDEDTKSYLLNIILEESIRTLENKYEELERLIKTYKDIFRTHENAKLETADEARYRRKVKDAEHEKSIIKQKLEELGR